MSVNAPRARATGTVKTGFHDLPTLLFGCLEKDAPIVVDVIFACSARNGTAGFEEDLRTMFGGANSFSIWRTTRQPVALVFMATNAPRGIFLPSLL